MSNTLNPLHVFLRIAAVASLLPSLTAQELSVPGHQVEVYADVDDPMRMAFGDAGVLYTGRDASGSGGGPGWAVKVHRIGSGGAPVTEYGDVATVDPDALVVDLLGDLGVPGSVIVGGQISNGSGGHLSEIAPDGTVTTLFGPTTVLHNPSDLLFDGTGRLLIANAPGNGIGVPGIFQVTGGVLSLLVGTSVQQGRIELDSQGRIFSAGADGKIMIFAADGTVLDPAFATGLAASTAFAIGTLNGLPESVYALGGGGIQRIDMQGNVFAFSDAYAGGIRDLRFGPDGALYVTEFVKDQVLRISEGPVSYCTPGTSASGCQPTLAWAGAPSASANSGFVASAAGVEGSKDGIFFFGTSGRQANPWGNSTSFQCVKPPVKRLGVMPSVGTNGNCDGSFALDLNARWCPTCPIAHKNPGPGAVVRLQLWYRDPLNPSNQTTSLSNALEFVLRP